MQQCTPRLQPLWPAGLFQFTQLAQHPHERTHVRTNVSCEHRTTDQQIAAAAAAEQSSSITAEKIYKQCTLLQQQQRDSLAVSERLLQLAKRHPPNSGISSFRY